VTLARRTARILACAALAAAGLGAWVAGCSDGSSRGGAPPAPSVTGVVFDYTDAAARDVPVVVQGGGPVGLTRIDGLFALGPVTVGDRVLRVGDSSATPTLLVPFRGDGTAAFLDRPVYLPALESGIGANVPAAVSTTTVVSGDELPGVSLTFEPGDRVDLPPGTNGEVGVVAVSPSRLPTPLPDGVGEARAAFLVEPHGADFAGGAELRIPRLDALASGPFDAYRVDRTTGAWEVHDSGVAPVGTDAFVLEVEEGTLYAVVPRDDAPTVDLTGRVVAGTQPVAGFRASCWNRVSEPTGDDGAFVIEDVPTSFGAFLVRVYPERAGVAFKAEIEVVLAMGQALGDVSVTALPADQIAPTVRETSPDDGDGNVRRRAQVVVTFSEPIDRDLPEPFRLVGLNGKVDGRLNFDNDFRVRFIPAQTLDPSETYQIVVDPAVQDLGGNPIDDSRLVTSFATRGGAPDPAPTDTAAFGITPLSGVKGDTIAILGRNFPGGSQVTFGSTQGLVTAETTDRIEARVPDFEPAGDRTISVSAGGQSVSALRPLVLDLRATVATIFSGDTPEVPLTFVDRADPPMQIVVDGSNVGGTEVTIDGVAVAAVDSQVMVGGANVATGRTIALPAPAPPTILSGPVVVRGANGNAGRTYRFLLVRE